MASPKKSGPIFGKLVNYLDWMFAALIVFVSLMAIISAEENPFDETDLLLKDSVLVTEVNRQARLDFLLSAVQHQHEIQVQVYSANEANRMQARLFFVAILAALASVAFASTSQKSRQVVAYVALAFGGLLYLLDVHMRDLSDRQGPIRDELRNTIAALTKVAKDDFKWYHVDHARIDSMFQKAYEDRWSRKFCLIFSPNLEQFVFYLAPMALLLIFRRHIIKYLNPPNQRLNPT